MPVAQVKISLKEGVVDPEGKNIIKSLHLLDFSEVKDVKVSRVFEITLDLDNDSHAKGRVEEMCKKLLANPVINDYSISFKDCHE